MAYVQKKTQLLCLSICARLDPCVREREHMKDGTGCVYVLEVLCL